MKRKGWMYIRMLCNLLMNSGRHSHIRRLKQDFGPAFVIQENKLGTNPLVPKILSKIPSMSEVQASRVSLSVGKVETSRYNGIINQGRQIKTLK